MITTTSPELLRILFNSPFGVYKETLERMMGVQRMIKAQELALNQFLRLEGMKTSLLKRIMRYLNKKRKTEKGSSIGVDYDEIPAEYLAVLEQLESMIGDITKQMLLLFTQIKELGHEIAVVQSSLNMLNVQLDYDIAMHQQQTAVQIMELFELDFGTAIDFFSPDTSVIHRYYDDMDVKHIVAQQQQDVKTSESQVIRLLNAMAVLRQYPEKLEALGLPQLNAADAQEMNEILREFRQHQMVDKLMSLMDCHDGYCTKQYAAHATGSAAHKAKIIAIQQTLNKSVASKDEIEEKLMQCEDECSKIMRKLPTPKMGRSCREELEKANNVMFRSMPVF